MPTTIGLQKKGHLSTVILNLKPVGREKMTYFLFLGGSNIIPNIINNDFYYYVT